MTGGNRSEGPIAYATNGTPYAIDEAELAFLQDKSVGPHTLGWRPLPPPVSREQALELLRRRPVATDALNQAISRLRNAMAIPSASCDLAIKVSNDLDTFLFHGQLQRRFNLR